MINATRNSLRFMNSTPNNLLNRPNMQNYLSSNLMKRTRNLVQRMSNLMHRRSNLMQRIGKLSSFLKLYMSYGRERRFELQIKSE